MLARVEHMAALSANSSAVIDLTFRRPFLAWVSVNMVDSLNDFDRDNAFVADIFSVDGVVTSWRVSGGDHWGGSGAASNVFPGAFAGFGQRIFYRLRAPILTNGNNDIAAHAEAIALTLD